MTQIKCVLSRLLEPDTDSIVKNIKILSDKVTELSQIVQYIYLFLHSYAGLSSLCVLQLH